MDLASLLVIGALVLMIPLVLFVGLVGVGILIWSWKRIGPYFVSFGRWVADWRNFIPLGCLGVFGVILTVLLAAVLPEELGFVRVILLALVAVGGFVFTTFALLLWTVRLVAWLWPRFRREFWLNLQRVWDFVWKGMSGERGAGGRRAERLRRPPGKRADVDAGRETSSVVRPTVKAQPPPRFSRFGVSWLWAAIWGRPQRAVSRARTVRRVSQGKPQTAVEPEAVRPPRVPAGRKTGLRPLMWRLGLIGRQPRAKKLGQRIPPVVPGRSAVGSEGMSGRAVPLASHPEAKAEASGSKPVEVKQRPTIIVRPRAKRRVFGSAGSFWRSLANGVEDARRGFWMGVFWVGRKARGGGGYVLRLLHLGGRRK